jgi:PAS domain S-box-containing protein
MDVPRPPLSVSPLPTAARRTARIGLYERDPHTGLGRWDDGMFALFGFDPAAGMPTFDEILQRVHPDDRERLVALHVSLRETTQSHADIRYRIVRVDGEVRHVHSIADVTYDEDGHPTTVRGVLIDETEAWVEARRARAHSALLERAIEMSNLSVWRIDLASRRIHFNAVGFRESSLQPTDDGVPLEEIRATIHPDDLAAVVAAAEAAIANDAPVDVVARYANRDGSWRTLMTRRVAERDADGRAVALLGISLDMSELGRERERSAALNARLAMITDAAGIGLFSRNVGTGELFWSAANRALYGLGADDPLPSWGEYIERFVHPDDRARFLAEVARAEADGGPTQHTDYRVRTAEGRERWIYSWASREVRDGQRLAFGVNVDVTDRHVAEAERRERERAEQAHRAQSTLLARVSHELRTPMNAVLGFADLLAADREHPLDAVQTERVERIRAAGRHLLALIDDVLDLAAIDADARAPQVAAVGLRATVAQVLPWVATMAQQSGVEVTTAPLKGVVRADPRWLAQVASNLLTNAIKYNRTGGWVRVETRRRTRGGRAQWALVVRDSGRGLSEAQRRRLFEPFDRLGVEQEGIDGSGIGLSIVRRLVERLGGEIDVASEPGQGAEFRVWLTAAPAAEAAALGERSADDVAPPPAPADTTAPRELRVLCIEDNAVNLALVVELLALRPGVRLRTATDGTSGLALARAEPPDVVLLDIHLPDVDGREVLRTLRADPALAGCTVIGLSANAMPEDIRGALELGFDDYWTKPIDFKRFLGGIDELAARLARPALA